MDDLIGTRDYRDFLNTRNELYRELDMKNHPPARNEAIRLMSGNPNLIRRPILVDRKHTIVGFSELEYEQATK